MSGEDVAPRPAWPAILLGLTLFGCGTKSDADSGGDSVADSDESTSTSVGEEASITDVNSAGCMTYAGPGCSEPWPDDDWPSDDDTTSTPTTAWSTDDGSTSGGDATTGTSGSSDGTDTSSATDASFGTDTSGGSEASGSDDGASESTQGTE